MFCDRCGAPMAMPLVCLECKTENRSSAKFCDNCGSSLEVLTDVYPLEAFSRTARAHRPKRKADQPVSTKTLIVGGLMVALLASIAFNRLLGPEFFTKIMESIHSTAAPARE